MSDRPQEIALLSQARIALGKARTIDEIKDLRDKAETIKAYAKKAKLGKDIVIEASVIKVEAERRLGQVLSEADLAQAAPGNQYAPKPTPPPDQPGQIRLVDLGVTKSDSSRAQQIARLPEDVFRKVITDSVDDGREVTTAQLLRLAKQRHAETEPKPDIATSRCSAGVADLQPLVEAGRRFSTIYADPPWPNANQAARGAAAGHYASMTIEQICAEPVGQLASGKAHLHLWTTNGFLREAFAVIDAWGFEYKSCFLWVKPQLGTGNYWRVSHEFLLLGVRGGLRFNEKGVRSWIEAERTRHSEKPEVVRQLIEQVSPGPYLELYGRKEIPDSDWTVYGNQVEPMLF